MTEPQVVSSFVAYQALASLLSQRPWYETHQQHIDAHQSIAVLLHYLQTKMKEEPAGEQRPSNLSVVPPPTPK